jgi:hypothetical protein
MEELFATPAFDGINHHIAIIDSWVERFWNLYHTSKEEEEEDVLEEIEMHSVNGSSFFDDIQIPRLHVYYLLHEQCSLFWWSDEVCDNRVEMFANLISNFLWAKFESGKSNNGVILLKS